MTTANLTWNYDEESRYRYVCSRCGGHLTNSEYEKMSGSSYDGKDKNEQRLFYSELEQKMNQALNDKTAYQPHEIDDCIVSLRNKITDIKQAFRNI